MKVLTFTRQEDGTFKEEIIEQPDDDTPQKRRLNAMAADRPGEIVVGWKSHDGKQTTSEDEDYLSNL